MSTETTDQVQDDTQTTEQVGTEQSETTEEGTEVSKTYKIDFPDGTFKNMSSDELHEHYQKIGPNFNKVSQELSSYKKADSEREARAETKAQEALDSNNLLKDVDPNVKEAIGQIAKEQLTAYIKQQEITRAREDKDREWNSRLDTAVDSHDGKDGLPKFDKDKMLEFMIEKDIYDPEIAYSIAHKDVIADKMIKDALKGKGSDVETESTGGNTDKKKPSGKTASTFAEAAKNAHARLTK